MNLSIQIPFLITLLSNIISTSDRVEFECEANNVTSIKYVKNNYASFPPLEYLQPEKPKTTGYLYHDLEVIGGTCFDLIIRGQ